MTDVADQTAAEWLATPAGEDAARPMAVTVTDNVEAAKAKILGHVTTLEPLGPPTVRLAYEDVDYWRGLTPREMSIWSAGYRHAEIDYKIPEEERL